MNNALTLTIPDASTARTGTCSAIEGATDTDNSRAVVLTIGADVTFEQLSHAMRMLDSAIEDNRVRARRARTEDRGAVTCTVLLPED